jgi:hypothetical protein
MKFSLNYMYLHLFVSRDSVPCRTLLLQAVEMCSLSLEKKSADGQTYTHFF